MTNEDIARVFGEIADLLELGDENTFRVLAYRNAERELRSTGYDLPALLAAGEPLPRMPGIGPELSAKIREICETGTSKTLEKLRKDYPPASSICCGCPGSAPNGCASFTRNWGSARSMSSSRRYAPDAGAAWAASARSRNRNCWNQSRL